MNIYFSCSFCTPQVCLLAPANISVSAGIIFFFCKAKSQKKTLAWLKLHFQLAINTENRAAECSAVISYGTMVLVLQNTTRELRQLLTKPRGLGALNKAVKVFHPKTRHWTKLNIKTSESHWMEFKTWRFLLFPF